MHWATPMPFWSPTPFWSVLSCHLCFLPGYSHPLQVLVVCAPSVCMWTTWTSLKPQNLPVQRLSRYALVIHSYKMSKPAESSFTENVIHTALSSLDYGLFIYMMLFKTVVLELTQKVYSKTELWSDIFWNHPVQKKTMYTHKHRVSKKLCQLIFCSFSVKYEPISIKIGRNVLE